MFYLRRFGILCLGLVLGFCLVAGINYAQEPAAKSYPKFGLPIQCNLGRDCFIQLYTDRDPGAGVIDWGCGRLTYDGHTGTDFAIVDQVEMAKGIAVVAAAPGKVLRVRDGVSDRQLLDLNDPRIKGQECGNGVVVDHGNGWQTQYCHLRRNSLLVKPGDLIMAGSKLGLVGQSGMASFPHVHFELRYQGKPIDPFLGVNSAPGCKLNAQSLWQTPIPYVPTGLIGAGFVDKLPTLDQAEQGAIALEKISKNAPLIMFWVRAYGVLAGDREHYRLIDPSGATVGDRREKVTKSSKTWFGYSGIRRQDRPLAKGKWRGEYSLEREGKSVFQASRSVLVE
jgi:murein DD-endopeptidase